MQEKQRDFSIIKGRILQYLELKGITKYAFYQSTGTTNGILSQSNGISEDNLLRFLANYKDINLTWLMRGEGSMMLPAKIITQHPVTSYPTASENMTSNVADLTLEYMQPHSTEVCIDLQSVPLYDAVAKLSPLPHRTGEHKALCQLSLPVSSTCDGALRINGESLAPTLRNGDIVLYKEVREIPTGIQWGEIHLLVYKTQNDEITTVKYIQQAGDTEHLRLIDIAANHTPLEIELSSICTLALIRATIRYNTL